MVLWRISNHGTLDGLGGLHASSRWHTRGRPLVYFADHPGGALIEMLVHLELPQDAFPSTFQLLKAHAPESISMERVPESSLAADWHADTRITREIGNRWLDESRSAFLAVPSVILPETTNWILNPRHPDAATVSVEWHRSFPYDGRLFRPRL